MVVWTHWKDLTQTNDLFTDWTTFLTFFYISHIFSVLWPFPESCHISCLLQMCHSCIYLHMWLSGYECFNRLSWGEWRMISSLMQVKGRCAAHYNSCSAVPVFPRVPAHRTCSLTSWNRSRNFHHFNLEFTNTLQ